MNKQWDLTILYNGFDDPKMAEDMAAFDKAIADVISFSTSRLKPEFPTLPKSFLSMQIFVTAPIPLTTRRQV